MANLIKLHPFDLKPDKDGNRIAILFNIDSVTRIDPLDNGATSMIYTSETSWIRVYETLDEILLLSQDYNKDNKGIIYGSTTPRLKP